MSLFRRYKIWKLQRPLYTNGDYNTIMAYTEGHENMAMIPMTEEIMDILFEDEPKVYVKARVVNGLLKVKRRVEEPDW